MHLDRPLDYTMPMVMDLVNGEGTGLNLRHEKPGELIAEVHQVTSWAPEDPDLYNDQCEEASNTGWLSCCSSACRICRVPRWGGAGPASTR